jgi:hypothetical protein
MLNKIKEYLSEKWPVVRDWVIVNKVKTAAIVGAMLLFIFLPSWFSKIFTLVLMFYFLNKLLDKKS